MPGSEANSWAVRSGFFMVATGASPWNNVLKVPEPSKRAIHAGA